MSNGMALIAWLVYRVALVRWVSSAAVGARRGGRRMMARRGRSVAGRERLRRGVQVRRWMLAGSAVSLDGASGSPLAAPDASPAAAATAASASVGRRAAVRHYQVNGDGGRGGHS